jgi:hypothetical protein
VYLVEDQFIPGGRFEGRPVVGGVDHVAGAPVEVGVPGAGVTPVELLAVVVEDEVVLGPLRKLRLILRKLRLTRIYHKKVAVKSEKVAVDSDSSRKLRVGSDLNSFGSMCSKGFSRHHRRAATGGGCRSEIVLAP